MNTLVLASTLTCPHCGRSSAEAMPIDACVRYWECPGCKALLEPRPGHCCVFCSYGEVQCPPVQQSRDGCTGAHR